MDGLLQITISVAEHHDPQIYKLYRSVTEAYGAGQKTG